MKLKQGKISIIVAMVVVIITGLLIMNIFGEPINKAFAAVTDPLLKKVGLEEDDSEQQAVGEELLENAKQVFNNFKNVIEQCKDSDLKCVCGVVDFTNLNQYKILLSNNNLNTKKSFLNLLDSSGIPDKSQLQIEISPALPQDIYKNSGKYNNYKIKDNYLRFAIDKMVYGIDGNEDNKFEGKMGAIYFSKPETGVIVLDKYENNKIPMYICRDMEWFGAEAPVSTTFKSTCTDVCSSLGCISGVDDDTTSKLCSGTDSEIQFEDEHTGDDYCICGKNSKEERPLGYRGDDEKPSCDDICKNKKMTCIGGVDDDPNINDATYPINNACTDTFGFEQRDDYCVCGKNSEKVIPVPSDFESTCEKECGNLGCIIGIDDGNKGDGEGTTRECTEKFGFEGADDYCLCGNSNKITPQPSKNEEHACAAKCGGEALCIMGVGDAGGGDGGVPKACSKKFQFEGKQTDDYCICGASQKVTPNPPKNEDYICRDKCKEKNLACFSGVDDNDKYRSCSKKFQFEGKQTDDYCVCGSESEAIPVPDDFESTCETICMGKGECKSAIHENQGVDCGFEFEFNWDDDYCMCGGTSENEIPLNYRDDNLPPSCIDVCSGINKCGRGVKNGNSNKICSTAFGFETRKDFCVCSDDIDFEKVIPIPG